MQAATPNPRWPLLGDMLLARGLVTEAQITTALGRQKERGHRLGECLLKLGYIERVDLYRVLAEKAGVEYIDLQHHTIDLGLAALIPEDVARRFQALPIERRGDEIFVAMDSPGNIFELDDLRVITECAITPLLADPEQLAAAINRAYFNGDMSASVKDAADDVDDEPLLQAVPDIPDGSITRLIDALLEQAVVDRASDIHIEPASDRIRFRARIDGVLRDVSEAPLTLLRPVVSRVKIMAGLDIAQTRIPQDGRFTIGVHEHELDIRAATLPSAHGESVVLRLLDSAQGIIALPGLGFRPAELERYCDAIRKPQGAVIVGGPTGSGKTSTLYATLTEINSPGVSIVSVEDPIEYQVDGMKQVQIHPKAGLTFPTALRSILRHDPDVIFIGEVRDGETARIAAESSITGHMVFSTIHTNSAAAVPMRLTDMGVEPYLVSSALTCIVAQRLARRLCERCAVPDPDPDFAALRALGWNNALHRSQTIRRATGCDTCNDRGYRGRFAIYEVLTVTDEIRTLIEQGAPTMAIQRQAEADGMDTMRVAGLRRVADGQLTVEELLRVVA